MLLGLLMLVFPPLVFVLSLPFAIKLGKFHRRIYLLGGGLVSFLGSSVSFYFAAYTGDQGGISAFFFQIVVIVVYLSISLFAVVLHKFGQISVK